MADIADPLPPAETTPVATSETATDTYVPVFRKELKKKDAEHEDAEFASAKAYLSTKYGKDSQSVYDHLTSLVSRILETKPANPLGVFESLSSKVKRSKNEVSDSAVSLKAVPEISASVELSKEQLAIFNHRKVDDGSNAEPGEIPDIMDLANLWEWAGLSFGKEETFVLLVSLKKLVDEKPLKSVRLWGKIFGTQKNYIVVEAELRDGIVDEEDAIANPKVEAPIPAPVEESAAPVNPEEDESDAPKPKQKPAASLPIEQRAGVNKYVYYVCNYAGGAWTRLPDVIPEKLQVSRQIRKHFTGDLTRQIVSFPAFNSTEAQYLRCQIARISAATVASPSGYYIPDPDEAEAENGENATIIINTEFEGLPGDQLLNPANWVHHVPYILPQGRMTWENPVPPKAAEEEEKEEDEEEKEPEEETAVEPETGPAILGPLAADAENGEAVAWTSRVASTLSPQKFSPILLRSTRWPGAVVVSYNDKFANVYMGDGLKDLGSPAPTFAPPPLPAIQSEYVAPETTPEILNEQIDPSIEAEAALEAEQRAKEEAAKAQQEGGEAEEPEEDE